MSAQFLQDVPVGTHVYLWVKYPEGKIWYGNVLRVTEEFIELSNAGNTGTGYCQSDLGLAQIRHEHIVIATAAL